MAIAVGSRAVMGAIHRPATSDDAVRLFEIRRQSIRDLARAAMTVEQVDAWAARLSLAGMELKLREFEIWVADFVGRVAGWGAIRGDRLEGLYISPEFAGRGVGAALLAMLEGLMQARGFRAACAEASSNAREFYLRRGYRAAGPQTSEGAWPIAKPLP